MITNIIYLNGLSSETDVGIGLAVAMNNPGLMVRIVKIMYIVSYYFFHFICEKIQKEKHPQSIDFRKFTTK